MKKRNLITIFKKMQILYLFFATVLLFIPMTQLQLNASTMGPQITHTSPQTVEIDDETVVFIATVVDEFGLDYSDAVNLFWRVDANLPYTKTAMTQIEDTDEYIVDLPVKAYVGTPKETKVFFTDVLEYYIEAKNAIGQTSEVSRSIDVTQYWGETDRYQYLPSILITEIQPDTNNVSNLTNPSSTADGYEFIEIYNNGNQPINLSSYEFRYMNRPSSSTPNAHVVQNPNHNDLILDPGQTFVIWVVNEQLVPKTVEDFYDNYYGYNNIEGVPLIADTNIGFVYFGGMPNGGLHRGWGIYSNTGELIVEAYYNILNNVNNDTTNDRSIYFRYPVDGGKRMQKVSANVFRGTPGVVLDYQVPDYPVDFPEDLTPPVIEYNHQITYADASFDLELWVSATDDVKVTSLYLYYKLNSQSFEQDEYQRVNFTRDGDTFWYYAIIDRSEFIRQSSLEFYIQASDGIGHTTTTTSYQTAIVQHDEQVSSEPLRANIGDREHIGGMLDLVVSSDHQSSQIETYLDGEKLEDGQSSLDRTAYFVYEVIETDYWFLNGVSINSKVLFNFEISGKWTSYVVAVPLDELTSGKNTISLHSGNRYNSFYNPLKFNQGVSDWNNGVDSLPGWEENLTFGDNSNNTHPAVLAAGLNLNRDDYRFRDVRLIMPDGTMILDPDYSDRAAEYSIGDSGTTKRTYDFDFTIDEEFFNGQIYNLDTTILEDGEHTLRYLDGLNEKEISFFVDNTSPTIEMNFEHGDLLKGVISIDPMLYDEYSGIGHIEAFLDDQLIDLPYVTASGLLDEGTHTVSIRVYDNVGNYTDYDTMFSTPFEKPNEPVFSLGDGVQLDSNVAVMQVEISDPTNDDVKISFYQGYRYSANELESFKGFHHIIDHEPPTYIYANGEEPFNSEDYDLIKSIDGDYFTNEGTDLPYQRFEVQLDPVYDGYDKVKVRWVGNSYEGRSVTLYAWNFELETYDILSRKIAGADDFDLEGYLIPRKYIDEFTHKAHILIQDEIEPRDFTFVWTSDTQYYSQRNSYDDEDHVIFEQQMGWILANREEKNIQYVVHTGDIVNSYQEYQWLLADKYIGKLDSAMLPNGVLAGNHDVKFTENDYTLYSKYFGEDRYRDKPWYGESFANNRGHYDLINIYGYEFMIVYIGWTIEDAGIAWLNKVISENPTKMVIIASHDYLGTGGQRSSEGDKLYNNVVVENPNVRLVLSGHYHGAARRYDDIDDNNDGVFDRRVFQVLADYQGLPNTASNYEGGDGYIRLLHFDPILETLSFQTYSPWLEYINRMNGHTSTHPDYLDPYNVYPNVESERDEYGYRDEFTIPWALDVTRKKVSTDYVSINILKNTLLSESDFIPSGSTFETTWTDLDYNKAYYWYAIVEDENMGRYETELYKFTTGIDLSQTSSKSDHLALYILTGVMGVSAIMGGVWWLHKKKGGVAR